MIKKGTFVNIYHDPITRLHQEGVARIGKRETELSDGFAMYTVVFEHDMDQQRVLRKIHEPTAAEMCPCYDYPGDNPDCKVHTVQLA
jgi:hypothetical protein